MYEHCGYIVVVATMSVFMLCSGADRTAKNADDKTALEVAQLNEQKDVEAVLQTEE